MSARTWDAELLPLTGPVIELPPADWDTLRETVQAGLAAARDRGEAGVRLVLYRTTKARGRERDRSYRCECAGGRWRAYYLGR
jgi:hypothetical protein